MRIKDVNVSELPFSQKYLISQKQLAEMLSMSVDSMRKLQKSDANFPIPLKFGTTRQAAVFYVAAEALRWIETKKSANDIA